MVVCRTRIVCGAAIGREEKYRKNPHHSRPQQSVEQLLFSPSTKCCCCCCCCCPLCLGDPLVVVNLSRGCVMHNRQFSRRNGESLKHFVSTAAIEFDSRDEHFIQISLRDGVESPPSKLQRTRAKGSWSLRAGSGCFRVSCGAAAAARPPADHLLLLRVFREILLSSAPLLC